MKEFKCTPGPWMSEYDNRGDHYSCGEIISEEGFTVAIITGPNYGVVFGGPNRDWSGEFNDNDEHEANGRLISASPDLLAALQQLVEIYDCTDGRAWTTSSKRRALDAAHAAIKKAFGE